jgi:hypothetical protein
MATPVYETTAEQATTVFERVDQTARAQGSEDGRTLTQRRADALCATPPAHRPWHQAHCGAGSPTTPTPEP